ncbi:cation:proton antiporter [Echinicola sp. CAU 1574]|uniref:Cation:proton antiporter n=1 Tax=Echinicola arenosa TaxID=2774144 RepID=A0ABR9APQ7_9BACT|nr:cation:proton antiporter [Echinicola arenosa]MBD8490769.1 cation:proton antiporter [Echinicola arenosa]
MTTTIIITLCTLLLIAYLFDYSFKKTKIPSVILLLLLGWLVRQGTMLFELKLPDLSSILPILGTTGLILIVLEGSLELELNKSKVTLIKKSFLGALAPLLALSFLMAYIFEQYGGYTFRDSLINAIPLCVISSAIAIPSVRNLSTSNKEFVIYESSLSDILGVVFFNFILRNETFGVDSFGMFGLQLVVICVISFVATIGLSFLLSRLEHHIKFVPIILLTILIYAISYVYHLPALIFILIFGLSIGNLNELHNLKFFDVFRTDILNKEVQKFKELTIEATFLIRSLFFLLFGYLLETSEILNTTTLVWSVGIVVLIFILRALQLKLSNLPLKPLLFVAPRGLITVLLFLSISPINNIGIVNKSLIIQVIVLTVLVMMFGVIISNPEKAEEEQKKAAEEKEKEEEEQSTKAV